MRESLFNEGKLVVTQGNYEVKVLRDSFVRIKGNVHRITTFRIVIPRCVLAELNTHAMFARNSASSRAIPALKMLLRVLRKPFIPQRFPLNHKGMQANKWVDIGTVKYALFAILWSVAMLILVTVSFLLHKIGITKQLTNRIVESMLWHELVLTATDYGNFLALRANVDAQDEIRIVAELMLDALNQSEPTELKQGEWHLPFGDLLDQSQLEALFSEFSQDEGSGIKTVTDLILRIVVARCARVSYANFDGVSNYRDDLKLFASLLKSGHWSAFEHAAMAMTEEAYEQYTHTFPGRIEKGRCAKLQGWVAYRMFMPRDVENRKEPRLKNIT